MATLRPRFGPICGPGSATTALPTKPMLTTGGWTDSSRGPSHFRPVILRPGLEFEREWSWTGAVEAGPTRLAEKIRDSMNALLSALDGGRLSG